MSFLGKNYRMMQKIRIFKIFEMWEYAFNKGWFGGAPEPDRGLKGDVPPLEAAKFCIFVTENHAIWIMLLGTKVNKARGVTGKFFWGGSKVTFPNFFPAWF